SYSWTMTLEHPLTGGGFEAFTPALFERYAPNGKDVHGPHSIYFGVLAEHGFTGLGLYLLLVTLCMINLTSMARRAKRKGDDQLSRYANMLRFSIIGFLVSGAFLGRAYFDLYFSIVAATAILHKLSHEDYQRPEEDEEGEAVTTGSDLSLS